MSPTPTPRIEIFGGYSYLPEPDHASGMEAGHGFALALDVNFGPHFGLRADFDAHFFARRAERAPDALGGYELTAEDITLYYYSVGPKVAQQWKRVNVFGEGLLEGGTSRSHGYSLVLPGATNGAGNVASCVPGPILTLPCVVPAHTSSALGLGVGGGLDARVRERFAIRVLEINYWLGGYGSGGPGRKLRLKTGVVFGFR